jgi:hypothetical protein
MYKLHLYLFFILSLSYNIYSQELVQISMGTSYQYDIFYSIENGITAYPERLNWELAFATNMYDNNIRINSGAAMQLYEVSQNLNDWESISSIGDDYIELRNSNIDWNIGAFVSNASGGLDYGWGNYNVNNNNIEGSKIYIINYGDYQKKIKINNMIMGVYNFTIANLDGGEEENFSIDASLYNNKKFIYFSLQNNQVIDREPDHLAWDFVFTQYLEDLNQDLSDPLYYIVTGVLSNDNLMAEYNGYLDVNPLFFELDTTRNINTIGYDWKEYTGSYSVVPNRSYFMLDSQEESVYKIIFDSFDGGSSGNTSFTIENIENVDLYSNTLNEVSIFPNPSNGMFNVFINKEEMFHLTITNASGQVVLKDNIISSKKIDLSNYTNGLYFMNLVSDFNSYLKVISIE